MERKCALFWILAMLGTGAEDGPVHSPTALTPRRSRGKSFYRQRRVLGVETAHSALMVILRLVIGGLISDILIVSGTIFSSRIVCFHLFEASSEICGSYSLGIMS